jgi:hypothetical protein
MPMVLAEQHGSVMVQLATSEGTPRVEWAGVVLHAVGSGAHRYCRSLTLASIEKTLVC